MPLGRRTPVFDFIAFFFAPSCCLRAAAKVSRSGKASMRLLILEMFLVIVCYPAASQQLDSVLYLNGEGSRALDLSFPTNETSGEITISAWIRPQNSSTTNRTETIISKGTQSPVSEFSDPANWEVYDATNEDGNNRIKGFVGAVFDGRYVYGSPWWKGDKESGKILRYDTKMPYGDTDSWSVYDAESEDGSILRGLEGAVFDGRYVYFVPLHHGTTYYGSVLRFDTHSDFNDPESWDVFESETIDPASKGFVGAVFDGTFVYFVPNPFEPYSKVLRLNTQLDFFDEGSWDVFDLASVGHGDKGYFGGIFDGRYVYFVPFNSTGASLVRLDTHGDFHATTSWTSVNLTSVTGSTQRSYAGAAFDGRYIYFSPTRGGKIVRLDTKEELTSPASWSFFEVLNFGNVPGDVHGGIGPTFDGRFVYFAPMYGAVGRSGKSIIYDTYNEFQDPSSWNIMDMSILDQQLKGFEGSVFDGQYVYFFPMKFGDNHGKIPRYNTMPQSGFSYALDYTRSSSSFGSTPNKLSFRVGTNLGVRSIYATDDKNLSDGKWHHIAATYDGNSMKLYVDGVLNNENIYDDLASINLSDGTAVIGNLVGSKNHGYAGFLDDVSIWHSALDFNNIKEIIASGAQSPDLPGPLAYWSFDDGGNTIQMDFLGADFDVPVYGGENETICPTADAFELSGYYPAGGTWTGSGITSGNVLNPTVDLAGTVQVLTYSVTDLFGTIPVTFSAQKQITYKGVPSIEQSQEFICANEGVTLSVDDEFDEYSWSSGETTNTAYVTTPGEYSIVVTDADLCQLPSDAVTVSFAPTPSIVENGLSIESSLNGASYEWTLNDVPLPDNLKQIIPAVDGHYKVRVTDSEGCLTLFSDPYLAPEPTDHPTNLVFASPTTVSVTVMFEAPVVAPAGYLVLRKQGSAPTGIPTDGVAYVAGNTIGTDEVVYVGASPFFTSTGLTASETYHYAVFPFNGAASFSNFLTVAAGSPVLRGSRTSLAAEPVAQPTAVSFTNITPNSLSLGLTQSDAQHYLILRKAGSAPSEIPVDGTPYTAGGTYGLSTVVRAGDIVSLPVLETGLSAWTNYHYAVYGYNGAVPESYNYNTTSPLTGSASTLAVEPSAQAGAVAFNNIASESATVSYTAAAGSPTGYLVLFRADGQPSSPPVDGTAYSPGTSLGGGEVAYVGPGLTFNNAGLLPEKKYFYHVFAYNGEGPSINYLGSNPAAGNFTTSASEPTAQPTLLSFESITPTGFSVSFTPPLEVTTGFIAIRKYGSAPTAFPADRTAYSTGNTIGDGVVAFVGSVSSFNESLLPATWHYTVFAYNGNAETINYNTSGPLTGSVPMDTSPPDMTDNTPTTLLAGTALKVSFSISDAQSGVESATLHFKPLNSPTQGFNTKSMSLTAGNYEADLSAIEIGEQGLEYRVVSINGRGVSGSGTTRKLRLSFPSTATLPQIPGGTEEADYRIISVPIVLTNNSGDDVFAQLGSSQNGNNWRMYRYDEGNVEITNLADLSVQPGEGYWLMSRNSVTLAPGAGMAVDATASSPFAINLTAGWNLIGNPYLFDVVWADVNTLNATKLDLFAWDGDYEPGTILSSFSGGFVQTGAAVSLKIPAAKNPSANSEGTVEPKRNAIDSRDWEVVVTLSSNGRKNPFGGVGMSDDASADYDHLDNFTLPRLHDFVELNHEKKVHGMTYTKDIVPVAGDYSWDFTVTTSKAGITEMTWDNSYFGDNDKNLVLWDDEEQLAIDMRTTTGYSYDEGTERKFRILFGSDKYVKDGTESDQMHIHSISPNPATDDVKVSFTLPGTEPSHVSVRVINEMGQQVANLFEGDLESGYHQLSWSCGHDMGARPAEGVYLVEVINGKLRESIRLVIR
jgi:hypothetical protein